MEDLIFKIDAKSESATKTVVKARNFEIVIDEPASLGGTDHGANPVEYLLASYAGCLNVVAHITAKELNIPSENLEINLTGKLNPLRFLGKSANERAGFKEIKVNITSSDDIDETIKQRWISEILDRCPVGDNLKNSTEIVVELESIGKELVENFS